VENLPELMGSLLAALLLAMPAVYFLASAFRAAPRSRRLADLALFCGLAAFALPELALGWSPADQSGILLASGAIRIILGFIGVALAVGAFVLRHDAGVGVVRPLLAFGFSLLHVLMGLGLLLFVNVANPSTPWTYQFADGEFSVTLPSSQWREARDTPGPAFVCLAPRMQAKVIGIRREQTEADFTRAVEGIRARVTAHSGFSQVKFQEGTNAAGNRFHYFSAVESDAEGNRIFVAQSVTLCSRQQAILEVLFEGLFRNRSTIGKKTEFAAFEKSAPTICQSIE
jgi:hypothetical protein